MSFHIRIGQKREVENSRYGSRVVFRIDTCKTEVIELLLEIGYETLYQYQLWYPTPSVKISAQPFCTCIYPKNYTWAIYGVYDFPVYIDSARFLYGTTIKSLVYPGTQISFDTRVCNVAFYSIHWSQISNKPWLLHWRKPFPSPRILYRASWPL